ncbi:MAG: hypothetical protein WCG87_12915 [Bacteroidota bacterium]
MLRSLLILLLSFSTSTSFAQFHEKRCEISLQDTTIYRHVIPRLGGCTVQTKGEMSIATMSNCIGIGLPCMFFADSSGYLPQIDSFSFSIKRNGVTYIHGSCTGPLFCDDLTKAIINAKANDIISFDNINVIFNCADCEKVIEKSRFIVIEPLTLKLTNSPIKKTTVTTKQKTSSKKQL